MPADLPLNFCSDEEGAPLGVSSVLTITGLSPLIAELKEKTIMGLSPLILGLVSRCS